MHDDEQRQPRLSLPIILAAFGLFIGVASPIYVRGGLDENISNNTRRIEVLETQATNSVLSYSDLRERMARMEAKLDYLIDRKNK